MDAVALVLSVVAIVLAVVALAMRRTVTPVHAPPPPSWPDERTIMELCNLEGVVEGVRTVVGPPPDRFIRPHGRSRAVVYQRDERVAERTWRYRRAP